MTTHAKLSPSARYRWSACPGSIREISRYEGQQKSSASAIDGTHSHTLLEHCIKNRDEHGMPSDPKRFLGMVLFDHEGMFAVEQDRIERVRVAVDYITHRMQQHPGAVVIAEQRVDPAPLVGRTDMTGTVDVQLFLGDVLELIDYKDGMNDVSAINNLQLQQYAVGVMAGINPMPFVTVMMTIIQPKVAAKNMPPISSEARLAQDLLNEVVPALIIEGAATDNPDALLLPGDKQCSYCPHRANCVTFNEWLLAKSGIKFGAVPEAAAQQATETTSDEQLREIIEAAPLLRKMIEAAEEEALRRITAGHPIPGLKAVHGRGSRSWAQEEAETATKLTRMGIPKKEVWKQVLISPAQAEKLKWTKRDGSEGCLTEQQVARLNKEFIKKSEGRLTVVPESDRRGSVDFGNLGKMFSAVQQGTPKADEAIPAWLS